MKKILLLTLFLFGFQFCFADNGDTIKVQTFTFDYGTRPASGVPRKGTFVIPDSLNTKSFAKVLMRYKLKCDPTQSPNCGEWDYITYATLKEKTGVIDSTLLQQPNFTVDFEIKDTVNFLDFPSWKYNSTFLNSSSFTNITSTDSTIINISNQNIGNLFSKNTNDGRSLFIIKASELIASGFSAGDISALKFNVSNLNNDIIINRLKIDIKQTADTIINFPNALNGLSNSFYNNYIINNGENNIIFNTPFTWDGTSNLLLSFSYESKNNGEVLIQSIASNNMVCANSLDSNDFLGLGTISQVVIDSNILDSISNEITVMFWAYGDEDRQPSSGSVFEGISSNNGRVINAHLPWENGSIYWDAGNGSTYDRINKEDTEINYKGKWNHWAFTKNATTGSMKIYLNGELWQSGTGKTIVIDSLEKIIIGACATCSNGSERLYQGNIDNFSIWSKELSEEEIKSTIYSPISSSHPKYNNLLINYLFNKDVVVEGYNDWKDYKGNRVNDFSFSNYRPNITLYRINGDLQTNSILVIDSTKLKPISIIKYENISNPTVATDTIYKWNEYYRPDFSVNGSIIDSTLIPFNNSMYLTYIPYYSEPFEIINNWELGRFITPYGYGLDLGEGWTWTYDVTDFAKKIKDTIDLEAGNFQELLDLQFWFIEGTPAREVKSIENIWQGKISLNEFANKVQEKTFNFDSTQTMAKLRTCLTGHGMEGTNSLWAEFSDNIHSVKVNGQTQWSWQIIQECAENPLYPQGGTWIYDRAGWCPGMEGKINEFELTPFITNNSISLKYEIEGQEAGNYVTESQLVRYGNPNFNSDVAVETIIVPSDDNLYSRENPNVSNPKITIKNNGKLALTSAKISYNFDNGTTNTYYWNGNLGFLETQEVYLPIPNWQEVSGSEGYFNVEVSEPNGEVDEYIFNNKCRSHFIMPNIYQTNEIKLSYKTNHAPAETKWKIEKANGDVIFESPTGLTANTTYNEVLTLANGGYKLVLDDSGDNGLKFWANMSPYGNGTAGSTRFYIKNGEYYDIKNTLQPDFGKNIQWYFGINNFIGLESIKTNEDNLLTVYPNPAKDNFNIYISNYSNGEISIYNAVGVLILKKHIEGNNSTIAINTEHFQTGIYFINYIDKQNKRIENKKIIIAK